MVDDPTLRLHAETVRVTPVRRGAGSVSVSITAEVHITRTSSLRRRQDAVSLRAERSVATRSNGDGGPPSSTGIHQKIREIADGE